MRRHFRLVTVIPWMLSLCCLIALASPASAAIIDGLISHWQFDNPSNKYADSFGGNHGTAVGTVPSTLGTGVVGPYALQLTGTGAINVGSSPAFDTTSYSVSAWLNTNTLSGWRTAFGSWNPPGNSWTHFGMDTGAGWGDHGGGQTSSPGGSVVANSWYHVVSVRNPGVENQLWVNGVQVAQTSVGTPGVPGPNNVFLGSKDGSQNLWSGRMDDVGVWNRPLASGEIQAIYAKGLQGVNLAADVVNPGLANFYRFENNAQDTANQFTTATGTNDHLTLVGSATYGTGQAGQALHLTGGYLTAPNANDVALSNSFTLEAWINPDVVHGDWDRLVLNWGAEQRYHFAVRNGQLSLFINEADGDDFEVAYGGAVTAGEWQHVAAVLDASTLSATLYLNGVATDSGAFDGTLFLPLTQGLGIGDSWGSPTPSIRYQGWIDELAMWDIALSPEQIAAHYALGLQGHHYFVPEPSSFVLAACGLLVGIAAWRKRRTA